MRILCTISGEYLPRTDVSYDVFVDAEGPILDAPSTVIIYPLSCSCLQSDVWLSMALFLP